MYKSCNRCGKIHDINKRCYANEKFKKKPTKANLFRKTKKWKRKAVAIKEESQYLCAVCKDNGVYNYQNLEVHHIESLEQDITRGLDDTNLICLCSQHHKQAERGEIDKEYLFKLAKERQPI